MQIKPTLLFVTSAVFTAIICSAQSGKMQRRTVYVKGTNPLQQITIEVPKNCAKFNDGVKLSLDAMVKYSGQELGSVKENYEKVKIISEYAQRIQVICAAQCSLAKTTNFVDPNESDYSLYTKLVSNYTEYQKVKDLIDKSPTEAQKDEITSVVLGVYSDLYGAKKEELIQDAKDFQFTINAPVGSTVTLYIDGTLIAGTTANSAKEANLIIPKRYMVPKPDKITKVDIKVSSNGFAEVRKSLSLADIVKSVKDKKMIKIS